MAMEPKPGPRFWSRLQRRWTWTAAILGALVLVYALVGFFLVPRIIDSQIRTQARTSLHREARSASVAFNPFTLAATISGFTLSDRDGTDLLAFDRLLVDLQVSGLFRRAFRFREIRIDRPTVTARIMSDGKPSIADLMESPGTDSSAPFQPPRVIVDRLMVSGGVVHFTDAARQPAYETRFEPLNLDVTDLITIPQEGGAHQVTVGVGDGAELRWSGQQTVEPLSFTGRLDIVGLDLHRVWEYAGHGQPVDVAAGRADLGLPYAIRREKDRQIHMTLDGATASIRTLTVKPRGSDENWLTIPELQVQNVMAAWPASRVEVERVRIVKPQVLSRVEQDGTINWSRAFTSGTDEKPGATSPAWTARLGSFEIEGGLVAFEDLSTEPDVRLQLADVDARATGVSSDLASPVPVSVKGRVQENGAIELNGTVAPSPLAAKVTLATRGIELAPLRPYIQTFPGARIASGTAALQAEVVASNGERSTRRVTANGTVDGVELHDLANERVMAWKRMAIDGLTIEQPPDRLRVRKVTLEEPFARIHIDRSGNLNLTSLFVDPAAPAPSEGPKKDQARSVEVGVIEIRSATADFSDDSLPLPFRAKIHSANGAIRDISSFAAAPATLAIEGRVDDTGFVKTDGTLRMSDPMASSEVGVEFRSIQMPSLTPYFADFAGYAVRSGVLDLDVSYIVKERRLLGSHKVVARDLVLGNKVDGAKDAPFPIRLAIALLKDREGRINLEVPVEGTVDSPEFAYRKVFWSAVRTILANAATAPFRAMGRLFGRDEDDLELVEFDAGRSDLLPAERATLTRLAEHLGPRPELSIEVEGRYDSAADGAALKRAKLEQLIEGRRQQVAATAAAAGGSTLELVLEQLFTEQFSAEALQKERLRFTPAPAVDASAVAAPGASSSAAPSPASAPFDAAGFYESLRAKLLEAQTAAQGDLTTLAAARSASIVAALTGTGGVDATRVKVIDPAAAKRQKKGSTRIASEMTMSADANAESER
jgi:hypothetical protein